MKKNSIKVLLSIAIVVLSFRAFASEERVVDSLYQVSTLQALLAGEYDGTVRLSDLLKKGDMGLGTFDKLAGEMIVWDGVVYQGRVDGKVYVMPLDVTVPFANVANLVDEDEKELSFSGGYENLKAEINKLFPQQNKPVLFCITGTFEKLSYRSVPAQEKPYQPLTEVVKHQVVFEKKSIDGFLVGFRFPSYMAGINVSGFHMHFLSKDKSLGGHLFGVESGHIKIKASSQNAFEVFLPETIISAKIDSIDSKSAAEAVEKLKK